MRLLNLLLTNNITIPMSLKRFILFLFVFCFSVNLLLAAKETYYGNIKLRSIGVGNMPTTEVGYRCNLYNSTFSNYTNSYGKSDDTYDFMRSGVSYNNYTQLNVDRTFSKEAKPFDDVVVTGNAMYAFPSNPKEPGAPIGDALPFVVLLAVGYVYIRNRE